MCKNPKKGYLFFNSTKCSHQKKLFYRKNGEGKHFIFINIITRFYHHADPLQEICIKPFKVLFRNCLDSSHPVLFFLFHCINKIGVRPASLRSRSFRASSSKGCSFIHSLCIPVSTLLAICTSPSIHPQVAQAQLESF